MVAVDASFGSSCRLRSDVSWLKTKRTSYYSNEPSSIIQLSIIFSIFRYNILNYWHNFIIFTYDFNYKNQLQEVTKHLSTYITCRLFCHAYFFKSSNQLSKIAVRLMISDMFILYHLFYFRKQRYFLYLLSSMSQL